MSAPSFLLIRFVGKEDIKIFHNWGWFPPTDKQIVERIEQLLKENKITDWVCLYDRYYGEIFPEDLEMMIQNKNNPNLNLSEYFVR